MKLSVVKTLLSALVLTVSSTTAANNAAAERWFEVELIVFSHAGSSDLKEQFDNDVKPIRLSNSFDLVSGKYRPDIKPLLQDFTPCASPQQAPVSLLPPAMRNWQQWQPPYDALLCISEVEAPAWQRTTLFPARLLNTHLPMPASLPVQLAGINDRHQPGPYLAAPEAFALSELATKIDSLPNQKVMLHTVWRQAPVTERLAVPSRWFAGENYSGLVDYWGQRRDQAATDASDAAIASAVQAKQQDNLFNAIDTLLDQLNATGKLESLNANQQNSPQINDSLSNLPDDIWQLDGLFKLHLDHYLFVNTEFNLRRPAPQGKMQSINVRQSRRVISGEIHYLDHPYLGIVLQIRRYQPPEPETVTAPQPAIRPAGTRQNGSNG